MAPIDRRRFRSRKHFETDWHRVPGAKRGKSTQSHPIQQATGKFTATDKFNAEFTISSGDSD